MDYFQEIDTILDAGVRRTRAQQSPEDNFRDLESDLERYSDQEEGGPLLNGNAYCGGPTESADKLERDEEESRSVRFTINVNFLVRCPFFCPFFSFSFSDTLPHLVHSL